MTDIRWIISVHKFYEHETIESMETELARLYPTAEVIARAWRRASTAISAEA